jgi:CRISPR-associated protein Cmr3
MYYLEPRDPLVVRDGRPNSGRSESNTLPFPYPGTLAGMVRTWIGSNENREFVFHNRLKELKKVAITGPLLALTDPEDTLYVPAPKDCLLVKESKPNAIVQVRRLTPLSEAETKGIKFDGDFAEQKLAFVGLNREDSVDGKAPKLIPQWWTWNSLENWLFNPNHCKQEKDTNALLKRALGALEQETRTHVKLGVEGVAQEGMLFTTSGLRYWKQKRAFYPDSEDSTPTEPTVHAKSLRLVMDVESLPNGTEFRQGIGASGGERRIVFWGKSKLSQPAMPSLLRDYLKKDGATLVRVVLLTPGIFKQGWKPGSGADQLLHGEGLDVQLHAALVPRPETISGWDFVKKVPKKSRRLVSAGSVYWIKLTGSSDAKLKWAQRVWWKNVSDSEQDRLDGFGLAVVGKE